MGAIHMKRELVDGEGRRNIKPKQLYEINQTFSVFDNPGVMNFFDNAAILIWRALKPLRDEVASYYEGNDTEA